VTEKKKKEKKTGKRSFISTQRISNNNELM